MNYHRPEIVKWADAVNAIQGTTKFQLPNELTEEITAVGAYEQTNSPSSEGCPVTGAPDNCSR
jgi:hypothetical protein